MKKKRLDVFGRGRYRHGTVFVLVGVAFLGPPDDEDDPAHDRDKAEQQQPAALADVVQTAGAQAQLRQQDGEAPNALQGGAGFAEEAEDQTYEEVEEEEPPELGTGGAAFKVDVVFQDDALDDGDNVVEVHICRFLRLNDGAKVESYFQ